MNACDRPGTFRFYRSDGTLYGTGHFDSYEKAVQLAYKIGCTVERVNDI